MRQSKLVTYSVIFTSVCALTLALGCQPQEEELVEEATPGETEVEEIEEPREATGEETDLMVANAPLQTADGTAVGTVTFTEREDGVEIVADLHGVETAGLHGIHVHETGECGAPDFKSAGGHFDPESTDHACPPTTPRHAGDLGNIEIAEDGSGQLELTSDLITVAPGLTSVVGKAMVLHSGEDDCTSQPSGAAGTRHACGVIALSGEQYLDEETVTAEEETDEGEY